MFGIKTIYTPDRSRQRQLLAQIKERQRKQLERELEEQFKAKEKKNANSTY